jgi:tRNA-dihydrouridine synthase B
MASYQETLYVGMTNDLKRRVFEHKNSLVEGFTQKYKCSKLVYFESSNDVRVVLEREKQLKRWSRKKKMELISISNSEMKDLSALPMDIGRSRDDKMVGWARSRDDKSKKGNNPMNFWREIKKPIKVLSPMAGYTDSAFRLLCKKYGADVTISELISADAIAYASEKIKNYELRIKVDKEDLLFHRFESNKNQPTADLLSFYEEERPFVVQLFGKNPVNFGKAAKWISEVLKPDGIDINMGCPARKVVGSDHGAALLKNPELAVAIVKAVKENTSLPVSVKTRLGWDNDDQILEFAPKLKEAGIDALILHGRTYKDGFKNTARWENIYKVKEVFGSDLIVIGNGDIQKISKSEFLISNKTSNYQNSNAKYPIDGIAIGRAAFGKPWIFSKHEIAKDELKDLIILHAKLIPMHREKIGFLEFRKHLLCYLRGFPGAKDLRKEAVSVVDFESVNRIVEQL